MKHKEKQKHLESRHFIKTARMSRGQCNIQEDTSQCQTSVEAPARKQAAGERPDFSKPFTCVFSPPKHPRLDKDGPCYTQDWAPLPKSPLEAPACGQAAGKQSAFCKPSTCVFSPPKPCRAIHVHGKTGLDEDVFHQPHQTVSCTGASEMPAFQPVRKQKSTERHIQAKLNSGDALQRRHKAVAPTQRQKAWKASSSEILPCISSKGRQNDAGPCYTQDWAPLPKSPLEAPACGQAAGKQSAFCKPSTCVFSPPKPCRAIHMHGKTGLDEDVFHQPHQTVSCTGGSEMPAFQPVRKQKSTEGHIQAKLNSGDALQRRHKAVAPPQHQKAWKASPSESFPSISSKDRQNDAGPCNTQDWAPLPKSPLEAPACGQAAGKQSAFCKPSTCVFSPPKPCRAIHVHGKTGLDEDVFHQPHQTVSCTGASEMPAFQPVRKQKSTERHIQAKLNSGDALQRRHKAVAPTQRQKAWKASSSEILPCISSKDRQNDAGPCNTQDWAPLPKSPLEAPACGEAAGKQSAFCKPSTCVFSPPKPCRAIHVHGKTGLDEDVFHQPHQTVSCTGASEMPAFQPVRKQKSTERHIQAKLNSGDALQRRHKAVAPTQRQKAWKASSSEILPCISSKDRQNDAGPCNTQDWAPLPKSPLEAPACGQAAGKQSAFCKPSTCVFSPPKPCRAIHGHGKTGLDEDVFQQPHQTVSCIGASEMPAFQPVRKQKSTERHIQAKLNSGDALQRRHKAVAPTQRQKAWKASSSEILPCISSKGRQNDAGPCNTQDWAPLPKSPLEAPACGEAAGKQSAFCKPSTCVFSPPKPCRAIHVHGKTGLDEDVFHQPHQTVSCTGASEMPAFQPVRKQKSTERHIQAKLNSGDALQRRHKAVAPTQRQKAWKASSSEILPCISSKDRQNDAGHRISQDSVPQPKSPVEALACGLAAGEKFSFSEHPIGVSTPSKRVRLGEDEIKEMPVSQDLEQMENSFDYSHTYIPNNNEPFMSPVHGTDVRPMKIYYMHVQLKRGVAVLYHTKEGWEPPSKKIKMEEMTYIGKVHKNVPVSHMSEKKHLIAHEPMLDSGAQENREEAHTPAQPPALGGYPSAKTPEWLVAQNCGFRCMACYRVFPSLAILRDHVEYGVREGFSCHVFHNAMAHLKFKARKRRNKEKKEKALFRR